MVVTLVKVGEDEITWYINRLTADSLNNHRKLSNIDNVSLLLIYIFLILQGINLQNLVILEQ